MFSRGNRRQRYKNLIKTDVNRLSRYKALAPSWDVVRAQELTRHGRVDVLGWRARGRALMRIGPAFPAAVAIALIAAGGIHNDGLAEGTARPAQPGQLAPTPARAPPPTGPVGAENPPPAAPPPAPAPPAAAPPNPSPGTPATVLDDQEVSTILGKSVRSSADEDMGRIVDIIVSRDSQVHAAIIDFGGFLGIGTRKIAVDWRALNFAPAGEPPGAVTLDLTPHQVRRAPEYKRGEPVVVVGAPGAERTMPSSEVAAPER